MKKLLKIFWPIATLLGSFALMSCNVQTNDINATPRIISVSPSEGSVSVRPDKITFFVGGTNEVPFNDLTRFRILESHDSYINAAISGTIKTSAEYVTKVLSYTGANIIQYHNNGKSFVTIDSTSECSPTLTFDQASLRVKQDYFDQSPLQFAYTLSGDSCAGKKLVLNMASTRIGTYDFGNFGQSPNCKIIDQAGTQKFCWNYSYLDQYLIQKFTFNVAGASNLSTACQAINNIGAFTLTGGSQSRSDAVSTLGASETVTVSYTKNTSAGGEQIIVRWLESNDTQIDPPIVTATSTGSTAGASQPVTGAKLRTYSVTGSWTVQYTCLKN